MYIWTIRPVKPTPQHFHIDLMTAEPRTHPNYMPSVNQWMVIIELGQTRLGNGSASPTAPTGIQWPFRSGELIRIQQQHNNGTNSIEMLKIVNVNHMARRRDNCRTNITTTTDTTIDVAREGGEKSCNLRRARVWTNGAHEVAGLYRPKTE